MSISTSSSAVPNTERAMEGTAFEDTIDGYFPLRESLRQMLVRNGFDAALVVILHAPAMEIPGLPPEDPVPLYITQGHGCMLHQMVLIVKLVDGEAVTSGVANWTWWGRHRHGEDRFSDMHRLAEPAFLRGVAFQKEGLVSTDALNVETGLQLTTNAIDGEIVRGCTTLQGRALRLAVSDPTQRHSEEMALHLRFKTDPHQQRILKDLITEF